MNRFSLLFLAAGLVSCAPLPPLVTDPPQEAQPAEEAATATPQNDSSTATETVAAKTAHSEVAEAESPDSLSKENFEPIAPASNPEASRQNYPTWTLPAKAQRDFRVGIQVGVSKAEISGSHYTIELHGKGEKLSDQSGTIKISASGSKIAVNSEKADSVCITPAENAHLSVDGREYRGKILVINRSKKLTIINILPIEDYLKGVVPNEIGKLDSCMFEALKVQAVAARTYAYRHYNSRSSLGFDVYATVQDQVYNGCANESALPSAAIDSTAGIVLTFENELIEAYYHSTCGGATEGVETWGISPVSYLKSQIDKKNADSSWCIASSYSSWKKVYSEKELVSLFQKNFKDARANGKSGFSKIQQIQIRTTLPGGRIDTLEVLTDKGIFTVQGDKIRFLFKEGSKILPSSRFTIEKNGKAWVLDGSGFGHGIGMCQMGARARAKAGQSFQEILQAYYPGTSLQCVHSEQ